MSDFFAAVGIFVFPHTYRLSLLSTPTEKNEKEEMLFTFFESFEGTLINLYPGAMFT